MDVPRPKDTIAVLLQHREFVSRLARKRSRDASQAADLEQEAWLIAISRPPRDTRSPRGWLAQVVRHLAQDRDRATRRRDYHEARYEADTIVPAADRALEREQLGSRLAAALERLPQEERRALGLRYEQQFSWVEIERLFGVPRKRAKRLCDRALARLRVELGVDGRFPWLSALLPALGWSPERPVAGVLLRLGVAASLLVPAALWMSGFWSEEATEPEQLEARLGEAQVEGSLVEREAPGIRTQPRQFDAATEEPGPGDAAPSLATLARPAPLTVTVHDGHGALIPGCEVWSRSPRSI